MIHTQDAQSPPNNTRLAQGANGTDESGVAQKSLANRKVIGVPFGPGNRANPGGRPKGKGPSAYLRQILNERDENGISKAQHFAAKMVEFAMRGGRGDAAYAKEVLARVEGGVGADSRLKIQIVYTRQDEVGREIIDVQSVPTLASNNQDEISQDGAELGSHEVPALPSPGADQQLDEAGPQLAPGSTIVSSVDLP